VQNYLLRTKENENYVEFRTVAAGSYKKIPNMQIQWHSCICASSIFWYASAATVRNST